MADKPTIVVMKFHSNRHIEVEIDKLDYITPRSIAIAENLFQKRFREAKGQYVAKQHREAREAKKQKEILDAKTDEKFHDKEDERLGKNADKKLKENADENEKIAADKKARVSDLVKSLKGEVDEKSDAKEPGPDEPDETPEPDKVEEIKEGEKQPADGDDQTVGG